MPMIWNSEKQNIFSVPSGQQMESRWIGWGNWILDAGRFYGFDDPLWAFVIRLGFREATTTTKSRLSAVRWITAD
jgi:hypothetical protein